MMKTTFLSYLAKGLNRYLYLDPESKIRVERLKGQCIAIELLPFHFNFQCVFNEQGIKIETDESIEPETKLRGTPLQMLGVMMDKKNRQRFFSDDVTIEGDAELGQQVIELFDKLEIDWEEYFSRLVGDEPAHIMGRFVRDIGGWLNNMDTTLTNNINEYIHEEVKWLPTAYALQDFFSDIDTLRMDVDRSEAKIKQLQGYLNDEEQK